MSCIQLHLQFNFRVHSNIQDIMPFLFSLIQTPKPLLTSALWIQKVTNQPWETFGKINWQRPDCPLYVSSSNTDHYTIESSSYLHWGHLQNHTSYAALLKPKKRRIRRIKKSSATNPAKKNRFHIRTFLLEDSAFTFKRSFRGLQRPPRLRFHGGSPRISVHLELSIKSVTMIIEVLRLNPK